MESKRFKNFLIDSLPQYLYVFDKSLSRLYITSFQIIIKIMIFDILKT